MRHAPRKAKNSVPPLFFEKAGDNKTKGNNSKSKKARVIILIHDTSTRPVLHFYQVSSKYSKGDSSYRVDKKFNSDTDADANGIHPKNNMSLHPSAGEGGGGGHN